MNVHISTVRRSVNEECQRRSKFCPKASDSLPATDCTGREIAITALLILIRIRLTKQRGWYRPPYRKDCPGLRLPLCVPAPRRLSGHHNSIPESGLPRLSVSFDGQSARGCCPKRDGLDFVLFGGLTSTAATFSRRSTWKSTLRTNPSELIRSPHGFGQQARTTRSAVENVPPEAGSSSMREGGPPATTKPRQIPIVVDEEGQGASRDMDCALE